jgi:hypothetical protein
MKLAMGQLGASEIETEADEPVSIHRRYLNVPYTYLAVTPIQPRHLPHSVPLNTLTTLLLGTPPHLADPAFLCTPINIWCMFNPPGLYLRSTPRSRSRINQEPGSSCRIIFLHRLDYSLAVLCVSV